jgi:hypothetical protein
VVIGLEDGHAGVEKLGTWHHDDIKPRRNLVTAENLSYQSLSTVTLDCPTQFFRGGDSKAADWMLARKHEQGAVATLNPCASLVYSLKFDASSDALVRPEPASHDPHNPQDELRPVLVIGSYSLLTDRRLRPFARRRFSTSRPFFVLIRTRNP